MADYSVDIQASLKGFEKLDEYERKINELSNKKVQVQFDAKGIDGLLKGVGSNSGANVGVKIGQQIGTGIQKGMNAVDFSKSQQKIRDNIQKTSNEIQKSFNKITPENAFKDASKYVQQQENATSNFYKKYNSLQNKFNNINSNFGNLKSNISSAGKSNLGEYAYDQLTSKINKAEQALANFNAESTKGSNANLDSMNASLKEFNTLTTSASKQYEKLMQPVDRLSQNKMLNDFKSYWNENTKAHKDFSPDYESIVSELENTKLTSGRSSELKKQIASFKSEIKSSGKEGKSWFSDTKRALGQIAQFTGVYAALQNVMVELPSQMMTAVKDVDAAKIELTKVSDAPTSQLSNYWNEAAESAKKYGATISDVISSTADWKRLGYNLNDSKTLSDATSLIQKVGDDMTQESSAEGIISTLKGFGMNASDVNKIIDSVNEVSNTQPIATNGLFEGLKRSASSMSAANNSLSQTIGLITAANSVVQDPASVGTAFKTISMRIRGATTELEDAGLDTEGMASSTAKLREEIQALSGVDIMKNDTTFKSTYDILDELASKWQNLTDIQQASITELIAGKRQGNIVSGLMKNFDIARQSYNTAEFGSEGSAEKELSNYQKSIEYHIGQMKASFQELSTSLVSSDIFKGFIDGGTAAINVLTKFIGVANGVPAILTGIGTAKAFKNLD